MLPKHTHSDDTPFFNPAHARWLLGVLRMATAVVGKESLLGLLLGQTQAEIQSLLRPHVVRERAMVGQPSEN